MDATMQALHRPVGNQLSKVALCLIALLWGCDDGFDPATLITEVRVLGISAEPPELAPFETTEISALVIEPHDGEISYQWELCIITSSPDDGYTCENEQLGLSEELLDVFDLGTEPTAEFSYFFDGAELRQLCEESIAELPELPDFVELPDCDSGFETTIRLQVTAGGIEKVAIKRLFLWFEDPGDQLNNNPRIQTIRAGGAELESSGEILVEQGNRVRFRISVDDESIERFVPEDGTEDEREEILFSYFSTKGEWESQFTFSEVGRIPLAEAGDNWLSVPEDIPIGTTFDAFFVIRDGRGGIDWEKRSVRIADTGLSNDSEQ